MSKLPPMKLAHVGLTPEQRAAEMYWQLHMMADKLRGNEFDAGNDTSFADVLQQYLAELPTKHQWLFDNAPFGQDEKVFGCWRQRVINSLHSVDPMRAIDS